MSCNCNRLVCRECYARMYAAARPTPVRAKKPCGCGTCKDCPPAELPPADTLPPVWITRIDPDKLARGRDGTRFNPSLIRYRGRLLMAYRADRAGSDIHVCELSGPCRAPGQSVKLNLRHPAEASHGREDPRLFVHRNRLHVSFIGVKGQQGPTSQLYAVLRDDLTVERVHYPHVEHRPQWEKNWGFFSHADELYAVYSISPHVIYRIDGDSAYPVHGTPNPFPWSGGHRRGGAAPVRVGDEYVCWFHGAKSIGGLTTYSVGVYAFEARPPFRVTRQTEHPIAWADHATVDRKFGKAVIFPCGAVLEGGRWLVSYGVHDERCELAEWDAAAVDAATGLKPGPPSELSPELLAAIEATATLPGWCTPAKARHLAELVAAHTPAVVVEVGVFGGRSLLPMAMAMDGGACYAVDPWDNAAALEGEQYPDDTAWWREVDIEAVFREFAAAVERFGLNDRIQVVRKRAADAASLFGANGIDLLHLDGNHAPEVTRSDLSLYLRRVRPGGLVVIDDTDDARSPLWLPLLEAGADLVSDCGTYRVYRRR